MTKTTMDTGHLQPEQITAFVDGELSQAASYDAQQHLEGCHSCTLRVLSATQLKTATRNSRPRFTASPELLARFATQLRPQEQATPKPPARILSFRPATTWLALAAAILLAVSLLGWNTIHQSDKLTAELLDQHLATLSSGATPQVISTDRHTVKPWFQGRLPFSFNLPEPTSLPPDTTLTGADLTYLGDKPAALLIFMIHKHQVSVFVTQRRDTPGPTTSRSGFTVHSATTAELHLIAVSDVNPTELDALLAVLAKSQ